MDTELARAGALPRQLTSFVGRERELNQARTLLTGTRLLTLTGPGGSGKTRACLRLADQVAGDYPDGIHFVPLAPIRDPALLLSSIAQTIGLQDSRERSLFEYLTSYLGDKACLLILDNFEQLLPAAPMLPDLLRNTLAMKIVVTSRASLRITGEQEFPLPPLSVLDPADAARVERVAACESVRLFVERARAVLPGFSITDQNASSVAEIVRRLDGLPLAIELAAARVKLLPPEAMLPRLERSLGLLVGGPRDLPNRHQTLRGAIAWSYSLLSPVAQRVLAACSVFRGGANLECLESVCYSGGVADQEAVLAAVDELVDHSLMRPVEGHRAARFVMLETIREYAAERLDELPERALVRDRHAAEFLTFAEEGERQLTGPGEKAWLELLDLEQNNIRAAMDWYSRSAPELALAIAVAMRPFWSARGHFTEGRQRLRTLLDLVGDPTPLRVRALNCAGWLATDQGHYAEAKACLDESIALSRRIGDRHGEGIALSHLGRSIIASGHPEEASPFVEEGLTILRETGNSTDLAITQLYWGLIAMFTNAQEVARERLLEDLETCRSIGFRSLTARTLVLLAHTAVEMNDVAGARAPLVEALPTSRELGDHWIFPQQIGVLVALAAKEGKPRLALRLWGFATGYSEAHDFTVPPVIQTRINGWLAPARVALGRAADELLAEGKRMTADEAIAAGLGSGSPTSRSGSGTGLTPREEEVAVLVARGLTNRDIASQLTLSTRTVEVHVGHVLTKLGFSTRTQLAAWAHDANLVSKNT